jgi:hypothetical protein
MYSTQSHWVWVSETGSVLVYRREEEDTLLGPLQRANLNHRTKDYKGRNTVGVSLPSPVNGNRSSFRNVVSADDGQSPEGQ